MSIAIRPARDGEVRTWLTVVETAFGEALHPEGWSLFERIVEPDRVLVATDEERIVGGGAAFSYRLSTPGGAVPAAGVTAVGILPSHRRQGGLTALMRRQLADVRARGEPVAILWASEGAIYQRFGYGMATAAANLTAGQHRVRFREDPGPEGSLRIVDRAEAAELFPPIHAALATQVAGVFSRTPSWWEVEVLADPEHRRQGRGPLTFVVFEADGRPEGYLLYRVAQEWRDGVSNSSLHVVELVATTSRAERELWRFCFGHDLIATVRAGLLPVDLSLFHQVHDPRALALSLTDGLWLRVVDVAGALEARAYGAADRLVLELRDAFQPELAGRWRVDTGGDRPRAVRTDDPVDLALSVNELGALYLGAWSATSLARAGRIEERRPGALRRADATFRWDRQPWCPQVF
jgi:predicted acetyltransferase